MLNYLRKLTCRTLPFVVLLLFTLAILLNTNFQNFGYKARRTFIKKDLQKLIAKESDKRPPVETTKKEEEYQTYILKTSNKKKLQKTGNKTQKRKESVKNTTANNQESKDLKTILLYTPCFGEKPWFGLYENYFNEQIIKEKCRVKQCRVTYDINLYSKSDVVVFHGKDTQELLKYLNIFSQKPKNQIWAWLSGETPLSSPYRHLEKIKKVTDNFFNMIITYKLNSEIPIPYGKYKIHDTKEKRPELLKNFAEGKTKMVAWMVGNCVPYTRHKIAQDLVKEGITIDIAGICESMYSGFGSMGCIGSNCSKVLSKYKFYFAAENIVCKDYVTEKYWRHPLQHNMVPIVLAANDNVMIPGSYISIDQFSSMAELAKFLTILDNRDDLYNRYFQWKFKYSSVMLTEGFPFPEIFVCQLCNITNTKNYKRKTLKMSQVWNAGTECDSNNRNSSYIEDNLTFKNRSLLSIIPKL
ncbi:4-galactosyl-N-acetylglucosaminide 3-alpha-L-fucosyltransferase FUT5-like [Hydractinia symbiolongicarpus]|uniref:4-galactosyl-N-acetylglucosaminide 3-alpha-L-fucosyltransferase FUT5-like n=1 Tax=Hydractinia symbiolongicarpus TaxID=13093 RepID=UPI00254B6CC0|nr:4-galactosyl-N-acetylglucosaminide 3-alpha-L-fucosyltransferase FUT5-like [Hydractinia symbiolongicarpus]